MAWELCEAGDLIGIGDGFYEDMGGHMISDRDVPAYFEAYLKGLNEAERTDVLKRLREDQ